MNDPKEQALDILARLGGQPATAFYESGVARALTEVLAELGVDARPDQYGNVIARLPAQDKDVPPIAFVAHMDHPGFEVVASEGDFLVAKALGGVPAASFEPGVPLQVLLPGGRRLRAATAGRHGPEEDRQILLQLADPQPLALPCPAVFDLVDFQLEGDFIRMRALDDLAGCAATLSALAALQAQPAPGEVYGVFTRAEEVGLVGARLLAEAGTLPHETLVVSLESSRTLPGAEQGAGPVIRVGDAGYTFNADAESALIKAREVLQARPEGFKVQRQLMSGGVCEASAFAMHGYRATGIAFPLGNYHNGAPEGRIEAEYIHQDDFIGGIELMIEAARQVAHRGETSFRHRLRDLPEDFRRRLEQARAGRSPG